VFNPTSAVRQALSFRLFWYATIVGIALGVTLSLQPWELSRWHQYKLIALGMPREQVVIVIDSSEQSRTGCGVFRSERTDSICRFEDPWREYVINFDPTTGRVNRKYFYFRRPPQLIVR
jgi:hypothetical protein